MDKDVSKRLSARLVVALAVAVGGLLFAFAGSASAADRNHDHIPDQWETNHHLSLKVNQANRDQDSDRLNNLNEFRSHTDPRDADTDNDGVKDANEDSDHDGVDNGNEQEEHTNPGDKDTDNDGVPDGAEDADHDGLSNHQEDISGDDPTNPDTNGDGVEDGDEDGGHIVSFDGTTLDIQLFAGGDLVGQVTGDTEIECKTVDDDGGMDGSTSSADDGGGGSTCTTADLVPGAVVSEAELESGDFSKVEIAQ
jgi:hypothetical protein